MARSRFSLGWIFVLVGLLVVAIPGTWLFMSVTAPVPSPSRANRMISFTALVSSGPARQTMSGAQ